MGYEGEGFWGLRRVLGLLGWDIILIRQGLTSRLGRGRGVDGGL